MTRGLTQHLYRCELGLASFGPKVKWAGALEGIAHGELNLALIVGKRAGDGLASGNIWVGARNLKLRMIEHVEEFGAKLECLRLSDVKILDRTEVHIYLVRSTQRSIA